MSTKLAGRNKRLIQGDRSREDILDAASALMSARGYSGTSMSELAKQSGLPASSIYWHFESKAGVLAAVMERGATRFFEDVSQLPLDDPDPLANLTSLMRHSAQMWQQDHAQFLRLILLLMLGSEGEHAQAAVVARVRQEGRSRLHGGLERCYAPWGPDLATAVADQLADLLLAMVDGVFIAGQDRTPKADEQLPDQMSASTHALAEQIRAASA